MFSFAAVGNTIKEVDGKAWRKRVDKGECYEQVALVLRKRENGFGNVRNAPIIIQTEKRHHVAMSSCIMR